MDLAVQLQFLSPFREDHRISHDRRNSATRKVLDQASAEPRGKDGQVCPWPGTIESATPMVYWGRSQGEHPIYLPDSNSFTAEIVKQAHETTLHGGVSMTLAKVRERFWVPRLRRLAKKVVRHCFGCMTHHQVMCRSHVLKGVHLLMSSGWT